MPSRQGGAAPSSRPAVEGLRCRPTSPWSSSPRRAATHGRALTVRFAAEPATPVHRAYVYGFVSGEVVLGTGAARP